MLTYFSLKDFLHLLLLLTLSLFVVLLQFIIFFTCFVLHFLSLLTLFFCLWNCKVFPSIVVYSWTKKFKSEVSENVVLKLLYFVLIIIINESSSFSLSLSVITLWSSLFFSEESREKWRRVSERDSERDMERGSERSRKRWQFEQQFLMMSTIWKLYFWDLTYWLGIEWFHFLSFPLNLSSIEREGERERKR